MTNPSATMHKFANRLASESERALEALPSLPHLPWRKPQRTWTSGETIAAFGLGLALGVALSLLLHAPASKLDRDEDEGEASA